MSNNYKIACYASRSWIAPLSGVRDLNSRGIIKAEPVSPAEGGSLLDPTS